MIRRLFFELKYLLGWTPWDTGISPPELMTFLENHEPGRALDIGCGTGTNLITMAQHGWQVTGVDFSSRAIRQAQRKAQLAGVQIQLIHDDVTTFNNIPGTYDLALDLGCFHSLSVGEQTRYASNVNHFINPGGTYLLYAWLSGGLYEFFSEGMKKSNRFPSQELITRLFAPHFELISIEHGIDHQRTSAWFTFRRRD
ncbi:MAG: class I SAM-dependent methyltransferase [Anaerolineaceae bacterium]|nr:MAG: class I SAM-dependent methyltransferase [Anaerolineaceae bacterium]